MLPLPKYPANVAPEVQMRFAGVGRKTKLAAFCAGGAGPNLNVLPNEAAGQSVSGAPFVTDSEWAEADVPIYALKLLV